MVLADATAAASKWIDGDARPSTLNAQLGTIEFLALSFWPFFSPFFLGHRLYSTSLKLQLKLQFFLKNLDLFKYSDPS